MSAYPDAPGHRNVESLGDSSAWHRLQSAKLARMALPPMNWQHGSKWIAGRSSHAPANCAARGTFVTAGSAGRTAPARWPLSGLPHDTCRHAQAAR